MITALVAVLLTVALALAVRWALQLYRLTLRMRSEALEAFEANALALLNHEKCTEAMVDDVERMTDTLCDRGRALALHIVLSKHMKGRLDMDSDEVGAAEPIRRQVDAELVSTWVAARYAYLMHLSTFLPVVGILTRQYLDQCLFQERNEDHEAYQVVQELFDDDKSLAA
jgi:hypothetical protein